MIEIPNYEIGKLAGEGGVAEVYLATHKLLERVVAIKIISPAKAGELADKRFLKEARVVAGLRHPNIVSIYDVGVLENKYYIIMEYLEGGDLKQTVKKGVSAAQSVDILRQIGSALAHAHDKGFIHRDIKSQNIMFRADGTAVLTDFGIVKDLTADTGYTQDGTSIGTPHYMSPEQAQGSSKIDWRTDLYSLGVTFYEMLTGSVPYQADTPVAVALKHIKDPVPQLPSHLSRYQTIIDRLMAKKPDKRFQSAHELVQALDKLAAKNISSETLEYMDRTVFKPRKTGFKPRPAFVGAALAIVASLAALLFFAPPRISQWMDGQKFFGNEASQATGPVKESAEPLSPAQPSETGASAETGAGVETDGGSARQAAVAVNERALEKKSLLRAITNRNYSKALSETKRMRRRMPASTNEMRQKADNLLAAGQFIEAGDVYSALLSVAPANKAAVLGLLHAAIERQMALERKHFPSTGNFDAQLVFLEKGIKKTDYAFFKYLKLNTVETLCESARNRLAQEAPESALEMAETGLKYAPEHLRLKKLRLLAMARISFNDKRLTVPEGDNALAYYRRILALDSEDAEAKRGLGRIAGWFKEAAETAYKNKNYDQAVQYIGKARAVFPTDKAIKALEWMIRADMHYERAEYASPERENARFYYRKVVAAYPENRKAALRFDKTQVLGPLAKLSEKGPLSGKIPVYRDAFQSLQAAVAAYGEEEMADVRAAVFESIDEAVKAQKRRLEMIPDAFINLVTSHFPEFDNIFSAQYEILIAKGDNQKTAGKRGEFYLGALRLNPSRAQARERLKQTANDLDHAGSSDEAMAILKQAMDVSPNGSAFKNLYKNIKQARDEKAELFTELYQIKTAQPFQEKVVLYGKLFGKLDSAMDKYGREKMAVVRREAAERLKADIESRRTAEREIPQAFLSLVTTHFPELENDIIEAQYDILMKKAKAVSAVDERGGYFLKALDLNPKRADARENICHLAESVNGDGKYQAAIGILKKAMAIAPSAHKISELYQAILREIEVYPTQAGCERESMISQAPVTRESLKLCIRYRNLPADSIVNIMLAQEKGHSFEVPVVLDGHSGNKSITVAAPIEGFAVGDYSIVVKQDANILSKAQIQFTQKRR